MEGPKAHHMRAQCLSYTNIVFFPKLLLPTSHAYKICWRVTSYCKFKLPQHPLRVVTPMRLVDVQMTKKIHNYTDWSISWRRQKHLIAVTIVLVLGNKLYKQNDTFIIISRNPKMLISMRVTWFSQGRGVIAGNLIRHSFHSLLRPLIPAGV